MTGPPSGPGTEESVAPGDRRFRTRAARSLLRVPTLAVAGYGIFLVAGFVAQRHVLFAGQHLEPVGNGAPFHEGTEVLWLDTGRERVEAWYVPPPDRGDGLAREGVAEDAGAATRETRAPALLFTHGNAELIDYWEDDAWSWREMGVAVLLLEYPGYGRSGGHPSQASVSRAATAAFDFLAGRNEVDPGRIVVYGRSVGGGPASVLTRERPVAALVLQSTFTDVPAMARRFLFPPFLVRDRFDGRAAVAEYGGPVLVFHGRNDDLIPFEHGEALAEAAGGRGRFVPLECVHNDCPPDPTAFRDEMAGFLQEHGILEGSRTASRP